MTRMETDWNLKKVKSFLFKFWNCDVCGVFISNTLRSQKHFAYQYIYYIIIIIITIYFRTILTKFSKFVVTLPLLSNVFPFSWEVKWYLQPVVMSMYTDSESAQIAITTVHSILVISNIAGNSLVCVVILKNQDMRYAGGAHEAVS